MFGMKGRNERMHDAELAQAREQAEAAVRDTETDDSFTDPDEPLEAEEEPTAPE
ncbi:hypothetical protein [Gordonia sp. (in: high G+C Gram-positive bacteria)]|nr:hypothetical protein [Gordonia sp. (in: high G+C Gram-positive bacteria)]